MKIDIRYQPAYSIAFVSLGPDEVIRVEAGAMVSMSSGMTLETSAAGGLLSSLKRSLLGGESFFVNTYQASSQGGEIALAPVLPGDMVVRELKGETLLIQSGAYVASAQGVKLDTQWGGARTFFASEGLIMLKASGVGELILSSYGAIHEKALESGESYTVDTGHLVAFHENMSFKVRKVGGLKSTLFSGEGLVVDLTGPGKLWMQTRSEDAFLSWLIPRLPKRKD